MNSEKIAMELVAVASELVADVTMKTYRGESGGWSLTLTIPIGASDIDIVQYHERMVRRQGENMTKAIDDEFGSKVDAQVEGCRVDCFKDRVAVVCQIFVEAVAGESTREDFPYWLHRQGFKRG